MAEMETDGWMDGHNNTFLYIHTIYTFHCIHIYTCIYIIYIYMCICIYIKCRERYNNIYTDRIERLR